MDAGKMVSLQPLELGTVVVIEAGDATSSAVVVESLRPMNWGDRFANAGSNSRRKVPGLSRVFNLEGRPRAGPSVFSSRYGNMTGQRFSGGKVG